MAVGRRVQRGRTPRFPVDMTLYRQARNLEKRMSAYPANLNPGARNSNPSPGETEKEREPSAKHLADPFLRNDTRYDQKLIRLRCRATGSVPFAAAVSRSKAHSHSRLPSRSKPQGMGNSCFFIGSEVPQLPLAI